MSEAQHAGAVAAFLQRQADRQKREADQGAKEEAVYQKVRAGGGDATRQMIREALAASVKAEQEAERARQVAAARRAVARKPGPGRPAWTPELFHERYREARAATPGGA